MEKKSNKRFRNSSVSEEEYSTQSKIKKDEKKRIICTVPECGKTYSCGSAWDKHINEKHQRQKQQNYEEYFSFFLYTDNTKKPKSQQGRPSKHRNQRQKKPSSPTIKIQKLNLQPYMPPKQQYQIIKDSLDRYLFTIFENIRLDNFKQVFGQRQEPKNYQELNDDKIGLLEQSLDAKDMLVAVGSIAEKVLSSMQESSEKVISRKILELMKDLMEQASKYTQDRLVDPVRLDMYSYVDQNDVQSLLLFESMYNEELCSQNWKMAEQVFSTSTQTFKKIRLDVVIMLYFCGVYKQNYAVEIVRLLLNQTLKDSWKYWKQFLQLKETEFNEELFQGENKLKIIQQETRKEVALERSIFHRAITRK